MILLLLYFKLLIQIIKADSKSFGMVSIASNSAIEYEAIAGFDSALNIDFDDAFYTNQTAMIDDEGYLSFSTGGYISLNSTSGKLGISQNRSNAVSNWYIEDAYLYFKNESEFLAILSVDDSSSYSVFTSNAINESGINMNIMCFVDGSTYNEFIPSNMTITSESISLITTSTEQTTGSAITADYTASTSSSNNSASLSTSVSFYNSESITNSATKNIGTFMSINNCLAAFLAILI
ncbi:hypothetical protein QEN19_002744 [Hanseniaspora menglaensis]